MAKKKCYVCKKMYDESNITKVLRHNICVNCYPAFIKSDEYLKDKFLDNIWSLYPNEKPNYYQLVNQVEEFVERYDFKYSGMIYALEFYLKTNRWNTEYLLGQFLPKYYYEAKKHWEQQNRLKKSAANPKNVIVIEKKKDGGKPKPLPPSDWKEG